MPKTAITVHFLLPTTAIMRVQDCLAEIVKAVENHKGNTPVVTIHGPIADDFTEKKNGQGSSEDSRNTDLGRRDERERERDVASDGNADDGGDDGKPKRGRGRPRKEEGPSSGKPDEREPPARDSEGDRRNEPVGTRKGSGKADREGTGRDGGSERSRDDQRGNHEASRVKTDDDWTDESTDSDWADEITEEEGEDYHAKTPGDNWPNHLTPKEIDKTVLSTILGDHYKATGGKDRGPTFELMESVTGHRQLGHVDEADYRKLAKALLKDIARYKHGVKRPK